mgnify:CR=1 FL=1
MALSKKELTFWHKEMEMLDKLYKSRLDSWQRQFDHYDLKFRTQIRDLDQDEIVKIPAFHTLIRQQVATIAFNYPKLFFTIEDEEGEEFAEVLERAGVALLNLMNDKPDVHQAIFDALITPVGWLRVDVNPPGDEMIPPYVANDTMEEDLTTISRVAPGFVHLDPMTPPHMFGIESRQNF